MSGHKHILMIWAAAAVTVSCSAPSSAGAHNTNGFQPETILTLVGFDGASVKPQKRFAGYTHAAQRISLIDPVQEQEAWGLQLGTAYDMAAPLPGFSGVAVLTGQTFKVIGQDGSEQDFSQVAFPIGFVQRAPEALTFALASKDGEHIHVVWKPSASSDWQEVSFDSPWEDASQYSAPPDGQPPLAVTLIGTKDTTHVVYIKPADGRYAYYEGTDTAPMQLVGEPCNGDGLGSATNATYRTMALDDDLGFVYAGDQKGVLSAFPPKGCTQPAARAQVPLGDGSPITDIDVVGAGTLYVTQAGGAVHLVTFDGSTQFTVKSFSGVCSYPLGALPAGTNRLAVVCYTPKDLPADSKAAPAVINYTGAFVQIFDTNAKQGVLQIPIDVDKAAGMAIDPTNNNVLTLRDDALGVLDIVSLLNGAKTEKKGLFLGGILQ